MDAQAQLISVVVALWGVISTIVGLYYRDLKARITALEEQLRIANESQKASNEANAKLAALVPGLIADKEALLRQVGPAGALDRSPR